MNNKLFELIDSEIKRLEGIIKFTIFDDAKETCKKEIEYYKRCKVIIKSSIDMYYFDFDDE